MEEFRRGWRIVAVAMVGLALSSSVLGIYTIGLFIPELQREFGWSLAEIQFASFLSMMALLFTIPVVATLTDKFGARPVAIVSMIALSITFMAQGLVTNFIWFYYALSIGITVLGAGTLALTWTNILSRWFVERRGLALGLALLGTGVGGIILKPITAVLIEAVGWRGAFVGIGLLPLVLGLPLAIFWFRPPPVAIEDSSVPKDEVPMSGATYKEALRDWRFWSFGVCFVPIAAAIGALLANMEIILADQGMTHGSIVTVVTFFGVFVIVGRITGGYLLDKINAAIVGAVLVALIAVACLLLTPPDIGFTRALIVVALVGLGSGVEFDVMAFMTARLFGLRAYSRIYGGMLMFFFLGGGMGPTVFGVVRDSQDSFYLALVGTAIALVPAVFLMLLVGSRLPPKDEDEITRAEGTNSVMLPLKKETI